MFKTKDFIILALSLLLVSITVFCLFDGIDQDCDRFGYIFEDSKIIAAELKSRLVPA